MKVEVKYINHIHTIQHRKINIATLRTFLLSIRGGETIVFTISYAKARAILTFALALNCFIICIYLFLAYSTKSSKDTKNCDAKSMATKRCFLLSVESSHVCL